MLPRIARILLLVSLLAAAPAAGAIVPTPAEGIGPGSHLIVTIDGQRFGCTAGWLFRDDAGAHYLSTAGHCLLADDETSTHGKDADAASAVSTIVCVDACVFGGQTAFLFSGRTVRLGEVAYARQHAGGEAIGSDFGLIRIPDEHVDLLRPGLPQFGEATRVDNIRAASTVCYYGTGMLTGETFTTMAREGVGVASFGPSWRMAGASNIGDSGAAIMDCSADPRGPAAAGILTHLAGGLVAGTTIPRGQQLARVDAGLVVTPYLG